MPTHISARLAWHLDGWNGHICRNPASNSYCVGRFSYPGELIAERRNLDLEIEQAGICCSGLEEPPPCMFSINAFGSTELSAFSDPPEFFNPGTHRRTWQMPPSTICVWPYEAMYSDDVYDSQGRFNYDKRLENAQNFFDAIEPHRSLVVYYANYSNPFSTEDKQRYVITGISRVKQLGEVMYHDGTTEETRAKFGGAFVWQRTVTSHYPNQGVRIPYHIYQNRPEILERLLLVPDNPRNFKYATREISDDEMLGIVEQFIEVVGTLLEIGDRSENWSERMQWLQGLIAELWKSRGLYPGLPNVLRYIGFEACIPLFKAAVLRGEEHSARDQIVALLYGRSEEIQGLNVSSESLRKVRRQFALRADDEQTLLTDVLPRFDLNHEQIKKIIGSDRAANGLVSTLAEVAANPYVLCEQFIGDGPDDTISFHMIDHGVLPSPELGGESLVDKDDWRRLRALCIERLGHESTDSFMLARDIIADVNRRLGYLPEWKRHEFSERYLRVDEAELSAALTYRVLDANTYLYIKRLYDAERAVEQSIRFLANGADISFKAPVTEKTWKNWLHDPASILLEQSPAEYEKAIEKQAEVCQRVFVRPISVICGEAGTGKTTVIKTIIQAVERAHGAGTSFKLLAPTGKAADRMRERTGKPAQTLHSFLAERGWMNENMTIRQSGGKVEDATTTFILDEASMVDLELAAAFFRAVKWSSVQRLVLVGDPSQLPPIGRGKIFSDIIDWLEETQPESIGRLDLNLRQMQHRLEGKGTGILDLASLYQRRGHLSSNTGNIDPEEMLRAVQEGGDVAEDLRVLYWNDPDDLEEKLLGTMVLDMESDSGTAFDPGQPWTLWKAAAQRSTEYSQIITPYRSEPYGTDAINLKVQRAVRGRELEPGKHLGGIALFDKVIQFRNRTKTNGLWAYNAVNRSNVRVDVFNGELGFVKPHGFDGSKWKWQGFRVEHFQVVLERKPDLWIGYGTKLGRDANDRWINQEKVEENLELAYAISVHKAQGSEFERVYLIVPNEKTTLLSPELFYTGLTRARRHCTLLIQNDVSPLLSMRRPENSHLNRINSSLFEFRPIPEELKRIKDWYEEGKIHRTLADLMVRSKSEVIIANMLFERDVEFKYEVPLYAPDGTLYLPDFTIVWRGQTYYWEHLGMMGQEKYRSRWNAKKTWYDRFFPEQLIITEESGDLSVRADEIIKTKFV